MKLSTMEKQIREATLRSLLITLFVLVHDTFQDCPLPAIDDYNAFVRLSSESKFLYPRDLIKTTVEKANEICTAAGLEPAVLRCAENHLSIVKKFIEDLKFLQTYKEFYVSLGAKADHKDIGSFRILGHENEQYPLQLLKISDSNLKGNSTGNYYEKGSDCLVVHCMENSDDCYHEPVPCTFENVIPVCQYQKGSECDTDPHHPEEYITLKDNLKREYIGSTSQKTMEDALEFCRTRGYHLFDFRDDETQNIWTDQIQEYQDRIYHPKWIGVTWTSGRYDKEYSTNDPFTWRSNGKKWKHTDHAKGHFIWSDSLVFDDKIERCLVLANNNVMRPVACHMMHYFMCYKNK